MERYDTPRSYNNRLDRYASPSSVRSCKFEKPHPNEKPPHLRGRRKDSNTSGSLFGSVTTDEEMDSECVTLTSFTRLDTVRRSLPAKKATEEKTLSYSTYEEIPFDSCDSNWSKQTGFGNEAVPEIVENKPATDWNKSTTQPPTIYSNHSPLLDSRPNRNKPKIENSFNSIQAMNNFTPPAKPPSPSIQFASGRKSCQKSNETIAKDMPYRAPSGSRMNNVPKSDNFCVNSSKSTKTKKKTNLSRKDSWSTSDLDKIGRGSELTAVGENGDGLTFRYRNRQSSFATGKVSNNKKSVYLDLGVYQTLVRPGKVISQYTKEEEPLTDDQTDDDEDLVIDATYGRPIVRDESCGEDTLRALSLIENKYDSFKRGQLRAKSFGNAVSDSAELAPHPTQPKNDGSFHVSGLPYIDLPSAYKVDDDTTLTERDVVRIELFFKSQEARVHACRCMVHLYTGPSYEVCASTPDESLIFVGTGVPVLLLNTGTRAPRRRRELIILLAHRGTGLPLWHDKITYLSEYSELSSLIHTMRVSGSMSKSVRFEFLEKSAAEEFYSTYRSLTSNPRDQLWKMSSEEEPVVLDKRGRRAAQTKKTKSTNNEVAGAATDLSGLRKDDISRPCNVELVTTVDPTDRSFLSAFGNLIPKKKQLSEDPATGNSDINVEEEEFRPRLPTH